MSLWVDLFQKYLEPAIFLTGLHRPIKRLVRPSRSYFCRRELERKGIYTASGFIDAARQNRREEVGLFVQTEMSPNIAGDGGETPLIAAARARGLPVVKLLLTQPGTDVNAFDQNGDTALIVAARGGSVEVARALLAHSEIEVDHHNKEDETAWVAAIRSRCREIDGDLEKRRPRPDPHGVEMWRTRLDLEDRGLFTEQAFVDRCQSPDKLDEVRAFLVAGMNVNARGASKNTGLIVASERGHEEMVKLLLKQPKINVNERNAVEDTALIVAARHGRKEIVQHLLGHEDILVNMSNLAQESALLEAARRDFDAIVAMLQNPELRERAIEPNLALKVARWKIMNGPYTFSDAVFLSMVRQERRDWVEIFLAAEISVEARDSANNTALHLAAEAGDESMIETLLIYGAAVNARNHQGDTALIVAARHGRQPVVKLLLDQEGIEVNADNDAGETALLVAAKGEHTEIVTALEKKGASHPGLDREVARWQLERDGLWSEELFVRAAGRGRLELVRKYLLAGRSPNDDRDARGNPGLLLAARNGHTETVRVLLDWEGIDADARGDDGTSALRAAAGRQHREVVEMLLDAGADQKDLEEALRWRLTDRGHPFRPDAFVRMAGLGQEDLVALYLDAGMAVDAADEDGSTALMVAAARGEKAVVQMLLQRGAGVGVRNRFGGTALDAAVRTGHEQVAELLREHGAMGTEVSLQEPVDAEDEEGVRRALAAGAAPDRRKEAGEPAPAPAARLLLEAAERGELERVRKLLNGEGARTARDEHGNTPLMLAARRGWIETVEALLSRAGDLEQTNADGDTALHLAAASGWTAVVEKLLEHHAQIDACNSQGRTALLQAASAGRGEVVKLLARRGADPTLAGGGTTPLVEICRHGPVTAVEALIEAGADVDQLAGFGSSPLMAASLAGQAGIVDLLRREGACVGWEEATLFRCVRSGDEKRLGELDLESIDREARDERGRTALLEAAERGQGGMAGALLAAKASSRVRALNGDTALKLAAASGSRPALVFLIADTKRDETADTAALLAAAERGHAPAVALLVERTHARINGIGAGRVPLVVAAARGHLQVVATLLELNADKDKRAANGQTALIAARLHGHQQIVDLLESEGAQAATGDVDLLIAAADGDLDTVRRLLGPPRKASLDARDEIGRTALMRACEKGHVQVVEALLAHAGTDQDQRAAIDARDRRGRTPLIWGAIGGERQIVSVLLGAVPVDRHAIAGTRSGDGRTALMEACHHGWPGIVEMLLAALEDDAGRRAAVDDRDEAGNTPLAEAFLMAYPERERDYLRIVDLLDRWGAKLGRDEAGLLDAARRCNLEVLQAKLQALAGRVEVDGPRRKGMTALMLAVEAGCVAGAELLLEARARIDLPGPFGATPLILAAQAGQLDSLRLLLERHADRDARDSREETALFAAVQCGKERAVEILIAEGANVDVPDREGRTPLMRAVLDKSPTIVHRLLDRASHDKEDVPGRTALTLAHLAGRRSGATEAGLDSAWETLPGLTPIESHLLSAGARRGWNEAELLLAARDGDAGEVRRLLGEDGDAEVEVQVPDLEGNTALLWACRRGDLAMARNLLAKGANPDVRNHKGRTPLLESVEHGGSALVQALVRPGLSLDDRDEEGSSALLKAARKGNSAVVILLAGAGAAVNLGDRKRQTPLLAAVRNCSLEAIRCLLQRGANACGRSSDRRTAAIEAAARGDGEILSALLAHVEGRLSFTERQAYLNAVARVDGSARTAFDLAEQGGHTRCVELLSRRGGQPVQETGYTVYLTATGDFYHRYTCSSCSQGRRSGTLEEIPIDSPRMKGYPPCDKCNPSYREARFDWKC